MKTLLVPLLALVATSVFSQCVISEVGSSSETFDATFDVTSLTTSTCGSGNYNYQVNVNYSITVSDYVSSLAIQIDCDDDVGIDFTGFPLSNFTGTTLSGTTSSNIRSRIGTDCATATPASIGCDDLRFVFVTADGFPSNTTITCPVTLPIDLIYFNAALKGSNAYLTWATATELDNDFFTIEKSFDGINFEPIATMDGAGTSLSELS